MAKYLVTQYNTNNTKESQTVIGLPTTKLLQKLVGGYLEVHPLSNRDDEEGTDDVYVNEEGVLDGLSQNPFYRNTVGTVVRVQKI